MKFDFDDNDNQDVKKNFNKTSKNMFGGKNLNIDDLEEESKNERDNDAA